MKKHYLLKLGALSAILALATTLSCTDHTNPDPEPVAGCQTVAGTPRAFPCEFKILKVEFLRKTSATDVFATVTPGNPDIKLPASEAKISGYGSGKSYIFMTFNVRVHVQRVAAPSFQPSVGYELLAYTYDPPLTDDNLGSSYQPPLNPPNAHAFAMPIGATEVKSMEFSYSFDLESPWRRQISGANLVSVVNNTTAGKLLEAPYSYQLLRDIFEANLYIKASLWE